MKLSMMCGAFHTQYASRITQHLMQPTIVSGPPRNRMLVATPVAMQAVIVNSAEQLLLMSSPTRKNGWQTVSGAMDANETLLDGTLREIREELGPDLRVRPLGVFHVESFHFDDRVCYMLACYYLLAYEGGEPQAGDDMVGSEIRWWDVDALEATDEPLSIMARPWLMRRAVETYKLWCQQPDMLLQLDI